jgi:hypothetical protein
MADQKKGVLPRPSESSFLHHQLSLEGLPLAWKAKNTFDTVFSDPNLFTSNLNCHVLWVKPIQQPAQKSMLSSDFAASHKIPPNLIPYIVCASVMSVR